MSWEVGTGVDPVEPTLMGTRNVKLGAMCGLI